MRRLGGCASLLAFFCLCAAAQDGAELRGVVVNAVTQEPIAGAVISAKAYHCAYNTTTNSAGGFYLWGMMPGTFHIDVQARGFIFIRGNGQQKMAAPIIPLKEDEKRHDLRFEMTPAARISGRVKAETGKPIRARVEASIADGHTSQGWATATITTTGPDGTYQLVVAPGLYAVKASPTADPAHRERYWTDSPRKAGATPVEVLPGIERGNVDFEFAGDSMRKLSGTVTGIPDGAGPVEVKLDTWDDYTAEIAYEETLPVDASGKFSATITHGMYHLYATCHAGNSQLRSKIAEIDDSNQDVELALGPGVELSGKVEMSSGATVRALRLLSKFARTGGGPSQDIPVGADGSFHVTGVLAEDFRATLLPDVPGEYVTVWMNGKLVNETLDLRSVESPVRLRVVAGREGASITGKVESKGKVLERGYSKVSLVSIDESEDFAARQLEQETAGDGTFEFEGVAPGKYHLLAQDLLNADDPGRVAVDAAEVVELHEGDRITHNAKTQSR